MSAISCGCHAGASAAHMIASTLSPLRRAYSNCATPDHVYLIETVFRVIHMHRIRLTLRASSRQKRRRCFRDTERFVPPPASIGAATFTLLFCEQTVAVDLI